MSTLRYSLLAALSLALALPSTDASACSIARCYGPQGWAAPDSGEIPANAPGLAVWLRWGYVSTAAVQEEVKLLEMTEAGPKAVPVRVSALGSDGDEVFYRPRYGFRQGSRYLVSGTAGCDPDGTPVLGEFSVGAARPLPRALGTLRVDPVAIEELQIVHDAMCSQAVRAAQVRVGLDLDASALPWVSLLSFETLVDGEVWQPSARVGEPIHPAGSWVGRGRDVLYAACSSEDPVLYPGLAEGEHEVVLRAQLPGTRITLTTAPVIVSLSCGATPGIAGELVSR